MLVLAFADTVTNVVDMLRSFALADTLRPVGGKRLEHALEIVLSDHLNAVTIALDGCAITPSELVQGDRQGCAGWHFTTRRWVRNICSDDHGVWLQALETAGSLGNGLRGTASELRVDLHQHIGHILRIALENLVEL